ALAHWKFGASRRKGRAKVRVYNPGLEEHGWKSEHTVIEIVNDDMPFLVDSVAVECGRRDISVYLIVHPVVGIRRSNGSVSELGDASKTAKGWGAESFMHIEINRQSADRLDEIKSAIESVLNDVRAAVDDWQAMREKVLDAAAQLESRPGPLPAEEVSEVKDFLHWIHDNNFTLLGYREFTFKGSGPKTEVSIVPDQGLGILRDPGYFVYHEFTDPARLRPEVREFISRPEALAINKTDVMATVHRPVYMDAITVRRFGPKGKVIGQQMFVGLFTSAAYNRSPRAIPLLRSKIATVFDRARIPANSHDGKALMNILETFPRDELFQASEEHLLNTSLGVLNLQERQRVALFLRRDDLERFVSCLVYVPRDRYDTRFRRRVQAIMERAFNGSSADWYTQLSDSPLARFNLFVRTTPGAIPEYDATAIEDEVVRTARSWSDLLEGALVGAHGEERGLALFNTYRNAFRPGYQERFNAESAVGDIAQVEEVLASGEIGMSLRRPLESAEHEVRFKIYHPDAPIPLSDALPMLEHMG
ncbi:MAG: NAD-glutamate dehydrogenase, partial [Rhodospirillales bacterium]|nr:NAD-glutamate dehydrogenase [Rhodospirillales bacterium]